MNITQFRNIVSTCKELEAWFPLVVEAIQKLGLSKEQAAMFIAQTAHESSDYNTLAENLNYSGERLKVVFPKYFSNVDVSKYNRNPAAIANVVYANRMGNGDTASGDGYRFRGRGVLQVTGRANYAKCSEYLFGHDDVLLDEPDLLLTKEHAIGSAIWFWSANSLAKFSDINVVTKKINGGLIGIDHRNSIYQRALYSL